MLASRSISAEPAAGPDRPERVIVPPAGLGALELRELWAYRELFGFLAWRDVSVRYKQSLLGFAWALLTPVITMGIFSIVFGRVAKIPSDGIPYPLFCYAGLLPWLFFSQSLQRATVSLVAERNLLTKVYFPRLIVPAAATLAPLIDLAIASSVLVVLMGWYGLTPTPHALYGVPLCIAWAWMLAVGAGCWLSALNVHFRDVGQMIPFLIQVWMYASPVVYPTSLFPEQWRFALGLNPMVGVIEAMRAALFPSSTPDAAALGVAIAVSLAVFATGVFYFKRMERTFSDVV